MTNLSENSFLKKPLFYRAAYTAAALVYLYAIAFNGPDSDSFFLIKNGESIFAAGGMPETLQYTIHDGLQTILQQWVPSVINYLLYTCAGFWGICAYGVLLGALVLFALSRLVRHFTDDVRIMAAVLILGLPSLRYLATSRPSGLSALVLIAELLVLLHWRESGQRRWLAALIGLSVLEINLHASMWWFTLVLVLPFVFPPLERFFTKAGWASLRGFFAERRGLLLAWVCMVPAALLNPYGYKALLYLPLSYGAANNGLSIYELQKPKLLEVWAIPLVVGIVVLAGYLLLYYLRRASLPFDWPLFYLAAGMLLAGCIHYRNTWMATVGAAPLTAALLRELLPPMTAPETLPADDAAADGPAPEETARKAHRRPKAETLLRAAVPVGVALAMLASGQLCEPSHTIMSPVLAADILDIVYADKDDVVLYTEFNNGAYMELRGYHVYIDARPELFQKAINGKEDIYSELVEVSSADYDYDYQAFLDKYGFTDLIVSNTTGLAHYLASQPEHYTLYFTTNAYCLWHCLDYDTAQATEADAQP